MIEVDLTGGSEATGEHTTYFAGTIRVADKEICVDGKTDRDEGWIGLLLTELSEALKISVNDKMFWSGDPWAQVDEEMSLGNIYLVDWDFETNKLVIFDAKIVEEKPTIWRVHAEKIAEDVVEALKVLSPDWFGLPGQVGLGIPPEYPLGRQLYDQLIQLVVLKISETLDMREDEDEV